MNSHNVNQVTTKVYQLPDAAFLSQKQAFLLFTCTERQTMAAYGCLVIRQSLWPQA